MTRPARRRFHKAPAQGVRISGRSGQGTATRLRINSNLTARHACSLSNNRQDHNSRLRAEVPRAAKIIFGTPSRPPAGIAPAFPRAKRPARSRPPCIDRPETASVSRGDRAAPAKAVVDAGLDGMLVIPEAGSDDRRRPAGKCGPAEVLILILGLGGPVRREHVFEAGADRRSPLPG